MKNSIEKYDPPCSLKSLARILWGRCQCIPNSVANVFFPLLPVVSDGCIPYLPRPHARHYFAPRLVITLLRGSSSPCPHARHHSALRLVSSEEVFPQGSTKSFQGESCKVWLHRCLLRGEETKKRAAFLTKNNPGPIKLSVRIYSRKRVQTEGRIK